MVWICFSVTLNIILLVILGYSYKRKKEQAEKRKRLAKALKGLMEIQVKIWMRGNYPATSIELEVTKYVRDVGLTCMEEGEYSDRDLERLHPIVVHQYPDVFRELVMDQRRDDVKR